MDKQGGPSWRKETFMNAPIIVSDDGKEYYKQPFFYALGHFSKFLPVDSVYIEHNKDGNGNGVESIAFQRPDNKIVLIVLNTNNHDVSLKLHDSSKSFAVDVKKDSLTSFIWHQ